MTQSEDSKLAKMKAKETASFSASVLNLAASTLQSPDESANLDSSTSSSNITSTKVADAKKND